MEINQIDERYKYVTDLRRLKTGFTHMNKPTIDKIPYISHNVWLTNPSNPREMLDQNDGSTENKGYHHHMNITRTSLKQYNFTTILWTNSISSIPKTKQWADSLGI